MFSAFNGFVTGRDLVVVPGRLLVQSWRGIGRREDDLDSNSDADGAVIQMAMSEFLHSLRRGALLTLGRPGCASKLPARWLIDKVLSG
jgi:hypothetical protein